MRRSAWVIGTLVSTLMLVQIGGCPAPANNNGDPNSGGDSNQAGTDPNSGGSTDPNTGGTTDPNTGGTTDPNTGGNTDPNTGGNTDPNQGGNTDPNSGGNTSLFGGSGIYTGVINTTSIETLEGTGASTSHDSQNLSIEFDSTTHALKQVFVYGYLSTPDMLVSLPSIGSQAVVNTFENGTCDPNNVTCVTTTVTCTLSALTSTATTMHLEIGVVHDGTNQNGYHSHAAGTETIDITLNGNSLTFAVALNYVGSINQGSLTFNNTVDITSSDTLSK